tara:strand:+ start:46 stop:195 length:150 start_codon:yes stop_codon:yes gene_type:complete
VAYKDYYKSDTRVNIIIKESPSSIKNEKDKATHTKLIKAAAIGLNRNYK